MGQQNEEGSGRTSVICSSSSSESTSSQRLVDRVSDAGFLELRESWAPARTQVLLRGHPQAEPWRLCGCQDWGRFVPFVRVHALAVCVLWGVFTSRSVASAASGSLQSCAPAGTRPSLRCWGAQLLDTRRRRREFTDRWDSSRTEFGGDVTFSPLPDGGAWAAHFPWACISYGLLDRLLREVKEGRSLSFACMQSFYKWNY